MNDIKFDSKKLSKDEILIYIGYKNITSGRGVTTQAHSSGPSWLISEPYKYIYEYNLFINYLNNKYSKYIDNIF